MPKKDFTKTGRSCRVTFELPAEVNAQKAVLCGEFNQWSQSSHPMKRRKDGSFTLTISLKPGQQYRYKFLLDGERWENDWAAEAYLPNEHGSEDSLVIIEPV
ncbi:MAG TPA: isoamylase early set domain-containing protein [Anaerolineales bacterium]|nr:isoamylase early set domain-containing protein [Anaerolineales bacterium]